MMHDDRVLDWSDTSVRLASAGHRDPAHPLRRDGALHAVHLCEYGAQAMAVHGGLRARADGGRAAPGMLVSLRDVQLHCARVEAMQGDLVTSAQCLHADAAAWQYRFRVEHDGRLLAEGRAAVMLTPARSHSTPEEPR
jgi:predicted hotdog family 3-hydroxylacyl-ACP dehydratase